MTKITLLLITLALSYQLKSDPVDVQASIIRWKGTKMLYTGKHEGTVSIKSGTLNFKNGKIISGEIIANMTSIRVTDIPESDVVPIRNIITHLKDEFDTDTYPEARFRISSVRDVSSGKILVTGTLTVKNISKVISVPAVLASSGKSKRFTASFQINRPDYNIGTDGNWLEKRLVDKEISLEIVIVTRN